MGSSTERTRRYRARQRRLPDLDAPPHGPPEPIRHQFPLH